MWTLNDEVLWWNGLRPTLMYALEAAIATALPGDPMLDRLIYAYEAMKKGPPNRVEK